jgi:predicted Fe-Mo cluster-binding NifX family protein
MAEKDVKAVITKNIGPRAFEALKQFNIEVYQGEGKIKKAIEEFIQGKLKKFKGSKLKKLSK